MDTGPLSRNSTDFGELSRVELAEVKRQGGESYPDRLLVLAVVEELLARDPVVLVDGVDADLLEGDAPAGGFGSDVESEVDGELIGVRAVVERAGHGLAVEGFVRDPVLGFLDDRTLAGGFLAVPFDGDDCRRIHRAHHVEVLASPA